MKHLKAFEEKKTDKVVSEETTISGKDISDVFISYENIKVNVGDETYFLNLEELKKILKSTKLVAKKAKSRTWLYKK